MPEILLVEDDDEIREDLAELLRLEGHAVVTAANGQLALDRLQSSPHPTLILLDLMMPVMSGWEFRKAQLRDARLAEIPVVVLSGVNDADREADSLNAAAVLSKPLKIGFLLKIVDTLVKRSQQ